MCIRYYYYKYFFINNYNIFYLMMGRMNPPFLTSLVLFYNKETKGNKREYIIPKIFKRKKEY